MINYKEASKAAWDLSTNYKDVKTSSARDVLFYRGYRFTFGCYDGMLHIIWGPDGIKAKNANRCTCSTVAKFLYYLKDIMDMITEIACPHMSQFKGTYQNLVLFSDNYFKEGDLILTIGDAVKIYLLAPPMMVSDIGWGYPYSIKKGALPEIDTEFFRFNYAAAEQ